MIHLIYLYVVCAAVANECITNTNTKPHFAAGKAKSSAKGVSLFHKKARKPDCKQVYDKTHFCTFCSAAIRNSISKHLLSVHVHEPAVQEILFLTKRSAQRRLMIQKLVNEGNFKHNISVLKDGNGQLVVGRRCAYVSASDYTACEFCKKFQSKKNLWRHTKTCMARKVYYQTHSVEETKRICAVKRGQNLVNNAMFTRNDSLVCELLDHMRDGEVKDIVRSDDLIRREASLRMDGLGQKDDRKTDDIHRVSQSVRTIARVVQLARKTIPDASLTSLIKPCCFDLIVDVAKKMSTDKDQPSLNVGKTIGCLLTNVSKSKYCAALRTGDLEAQQDATNFQHLLQREWNDRVNRTASKRMQREKRMTVPTIPITEDLKKFRDYIMRNVERLSQKLKKHHGPEDWVLLAKFVMCRLILFNKRRRAEVRELKVSEYLARPNWKNDNSGEMSLALSSVDRLLADMYNNLQYHYYY